MTTKLIQGAYSAITLIGILVNISGVSVFLAGTDSTLATNVARTKAGWFMDRDRDSLDARYAAPVATNEFDRVASTEIQ